MVRLPPGDPVALDQIVRGVHTLGGWPLISAKAALLAQHVERIVTQQAATARGAGLTPNNAGTFAEAIARAGQAGVAELADARPALTAFTAATARFAPVVSNQLALAEDVGRQIAQRRIDDSLVEVIREMRRYLTGFDDRIFALNTLQYPTTVTLKPSLAASGTGAAQDPVGDLRIKAQQLAKLQAAQQAKDLDGALAAASTAVAGPSVLIIVGTLAWQQAASRSVALAAARNTLAAEHPVLHRLELADLGAPGRKTPPTDAELLTALKDAFATTWKAANQVRENISAQAWSVDLAGHAAGPSAGLAERLRDRGMKGGLASLIDPRYGPWAYQEVMAEAARTVAGPGQSVVSQAVHDVYQAVDPSLGAEFGEMIALTGALAALHLAAPPLAIVADVVLAAKGIWEALVGFFRGQAAYECTLNPAGSFAVAPSMLRLALQCVGEVAGALPGGKITTSVSILAPLAGGLI